MVAPRGASGGGRRGECLEAREGGRQLTGPRPVTCEAQRALAGVAGDPPGLVKQPVAQSLELPGARVVFEAQRLGPGDDVLGKHHQEQPHLVVGEAHKRQVCQAAVLALADVTLDVGVGAMVEIELGNAAVVVGHKDRQAVAVVVGEGLLVALSQLAAPCDQP